MSSKVVYITGAASGMGWACAKRFAADGAIVIGSDLKPSAADFPGDEYHQCDVSNEEQQMAVVSAVLEKHGRIDAAVTCAGIAGGGFVHQLSLKHWKKVQDVNLTGTFLTCKAVLPAMMQQGGGSMHSNNCFRTGARSKQ